MVNPYHTALMDDHEADIRTSRFPITRVVIGTTKGALIGLGVSLALFGIPNLFSWLTHPYFYWTAPSDPLNGPAGVIVFASVCGLSLGFLAGLASSIPPAQVSLFRCFLTIALVAGVVRVITVEMFNNPYFGTETGYYSYLSTAAAAIVTTGVLVAYGINKQRP